MRDARYAVRALWNSRGFTIVAVLCLAFGIGLNTTIFSVVDGVLLKPFPYQDAERLIVLRAANDRRGIDESGVSYADWQDLRRRRDSIAATAALQFRSIALSDTGLEPERYPAAAVSWDLFPMLGVAPIRGQGFTTEMDRPGAGGVVLIAHSVWRDRYQLDPGVVGRRVLLNGAPAVIVGVMPEHFAFPQNQRLWVPLAPVAAQAPRAQRDLDIFAKLAPAATIEGAQAELTATADNLARQYPDSNDGWTVRAVTLRDDFIPTDVSLVIWIMMASVTLVLLIACSNVANLQLARASTRQREFSVRAALGAGRGRLVRQLLTESIVLGLISLPLAMALAQVGTGLIASAMPADQVPYYITWEVDWRTWTYAVAVAVGTAVLFGLLPALQSSRGNLVESLKEGTRGNSVRRSPLRSALVVVQVALAVVALVGALLFVRTFTNLDAYAVGFEPAPLVTMRFYMPGEVYEASDARARRVEDVIRRVEALPGVRSAFASNLIPLSGGGGGGPVQVDGRPDTPDRRPFIGFIGVTPHFHRTLAVLMTEGRDFTDAESWGAEPVAVINETMARELWEGRSAIGGRFKMAGSDASAVWFTVIGVSPDIKHDDIDPDDQPFSAAYVPYRFQQTFSTGIVVRVEGDPYAIVPSVREAVRASDATLPLSAIRSMEDVRRLGFWQYGLFGWIFGVTGLVGLLLAAVGVYGVLSYAVAQRTTEIGVRMALGAARRQVLGLIVGHGLLLAGIGVAAGLVIAPLGTWFGRSLFYEVSPFDPVTFAAVSVFLIAVAALASYVPARRATRVDPVQALRGE